MSFPDYSPEADLKRFPLGTHLLFVIRKRTGTSTHLDIYEPWSHKEGNGATMYANLTMHVARICGHRLSKDQSIIWKGGGMRASTAIMYSLSRKIHDRVDNVFKGVEL